MLRSKPEGVIRDRLAWALGKEGHTVAHERRERWDLTILDDTSADTSAQTVVCLGVTAATAVFGRAVTIASTRGREHCIGGRRTLVTVHPSSLLRINDADERDVAMAAFVKDLRAAAPRRAS